MTDRNVDDDRRQRRFTDERDGSASSIGREASIEGTIKGSTNLEIWGSFEGEIQIEGLVWLRPGSRFAGELVTTDLVVEGELCGTVRATRKVDMRASCHVEADVTAARVAAAEGSHIEGRIHVSGPGDAVVGYNERRGS
ncbi:MAG: polymer-forming cytoskeletal protein [Candidatus Sulfomarinibacteraceae bacterium]